MERRWRFLGAAALLLWGPASTTEAGSARTAFGVTAEVVRRCAIDTGASESPFVTCARGAPTPRIARRLAPSLAAAPGAVTPRVNETDDPDGATVRVSVDF